MNCDLFQEELCCLSDRCYRSADGQSAILALMKAVRSRVVNGKPPAQTTSESKSTLLSHLRIKSFDELEEQIYPRRIGFCIDSPTAPLRVVELWLFSDHRRVYVCVCEWYTSICGQSRSDGHTDVICTNQQEAVITSSPCRIFQTSIGMGSKKKPLFLLIWAWLHRLLAPRETTETPSFRELSVFSQHEEEEDRLHRFHLEASFPIVLWLSWLFGKECLYPTWLAVRPIWSNHYSFPLFHCLMTNLGTNAFCSRRVNLLSPYQSLLHPTLSTPSLFAEDTHCKSLLSSQGVCGIFAVWDFTYKHLSDL